MKFLWLIFCSPLGAREAPTCGRRASLFEWPLLNTHALFLMSEFWIFKDSRD
jgi:hypothetical protein